MYFICQNWWIYFLRKRDWFLLLLIEASDFPFNVYIMRRGGNWEIIVLFLGFWVKEKRKKEGRNKNGFSISVLHLRDVAVSDKIYDVFHTLSFRSFSGGQLCSYNSLSAPFLEVNFVDIINKFILFGRLLFGSLFCLTISN